MSEQAENEACRQIDIEDVSAEEVFEAIATGEGRERWLGEPQRDIQIESLDPPTRLTWWWAGADEPATRVSFEILPLPSGVRVLVTESAPRLPLLALRASFELVLA